MCGRWPVDSKLQTCSGSGRALHGVQAVRSLVCPLPPSPVHSLGAQDSCCAVFKSSWFQELWTWSHSQAWASSGLEGGCETWPGMGTGAGLPVSRGSCSNCSSSM